MRRIAVLRTLSALGLAVPRVLCAQETLPQRVDRYEHLRVEASAAPVANLRLSAGHLNLLLMSGGASPVKAGEETVGLFFQGLGQLEYQSADPVEFPVLAFNVKKATSLAVERTEGRMIVRDTFQRLLWLSGGRPIPPLAGSRGPSLEAAFAKHLEKFRPARGYTVSHLLAAQSEDATAAPVAVALLEGGHEDLVYVLDGLWNRSESLTSFRKSGSSDSEMRKFLFPTLLSDQPIERDRRDPLVPLYLLTGVDLTMSASSGNQASMSVVETLVPLARTQRTFRFDLYDTTYAQVGSGSLQPRSWRLRAVTDASGAPLSFDHRDGEVLVEARAAQPPDRPLKLRFEIEGDFLVRPGGDNFWQLGLGGGPWFPQPDLNGQLYDFHCVLRVKKPFVPFASGKTISRRSEGDENVLETRTENPVAFPAMIAGAYDFEEETRNGLTIRVASYAMKNKHAMKQLAELAFSIIEDYETFLGPFPFSEYDIVEINEWGFGQAPPGILFITKEAFNPLMGEENQLFSQGVNERFAHEIAHQYWGQVVKMPSLEEQWLTESFAEYSAAIFLRAFRGQSTYKSLVRHWKSGASQATAAAPIPLANRISIPSDPLTRFVYRTDLIYDKGAYLLAVLHKELGDQTFLTFLKSYQRSFRWKFGSTKTVAGLLQWLTKKDYSPFFEANYWGTGMPAD